MKRRSSTSKPPLSRNNSLNNKDEITQFRSNKLSFTKLILCGLI